MARTRRIAPVCRFVPILSAAVLTACGTLIPPEDFEDPVIVTAPAAVQEIPVQDPVVDLPPSAMLRAPQVVSNLPRPRMPASVRRPVPPLKPPPSMDTAPDPEAVAPSDLVGFDFPAVLQVLKQPDNVQNSALSVVWTYSKSDCTLQLYFYPDIRTRTFHLLKYDLKDGTGEKPSDSSPCMRHIVTRTDESTSP